MPSYSLSALAARGWGLAWVAVAKKIIFRGLKKCFFRHCPCEPQTQCFGLWNIVFLHSPERWNGINPSRGDWRGQARHCQKKRDLKNVFSARPLVNLRNETQLFFLCPKPTDQTRPALQENNFSGSIFFRTRPERWNGMNPSHGDWRGQARHCEKKMRPEKLFFRHCSCETQTSPALQKETIFEALKKCVFACLLLNLPTRPRCLALARSELRRCPKNLRDPRPIVVEICLHLKTKIWGTLGFKLSDS